MIHVSLNLDLFLEPFSANEQNFELPLELLTWKQVGPISLEGATNRNGPPKEIIFQLKPSGD